MAGRVLRARGQPTDREAGSATRDHLLRMKGEIVHEFKCEWVVVTARTGYKAEGERCLDHLPVFKAQQELSYLVPITRGLTPGVQCPP